MAQQRTQEASATGATKERYPGMREFATNAFRNVPATEHGVLSRKMKHYLEVAKSQGLATEMNWALESVASLEKRFGSVSNGETPVPEVGHSRELKHAGHKPALKSGVGPARAGSAGVGSARAVAARSFGANAAGASLKAGSDALLHAAHTNKSTDRPSKRPAEDSIAGSKRQFNGSKADTKRAQRLQRFQTGQQQSAPAPYVDQQIQGTVVGTSEALEKPYFRLTGQVNPAAVRPPAVLEKALDFVLEKYATDKSNYAYISSQLQSIRQDLTVQHIETPLTLSVYEQNARIALAHDDIGEFNKCLTRVTSLYEQHPTMGKNGLEFKAYSIYYTLLLWKWDEISLILRKQKPPKFRWPPILVGRQTAPPDAEFPETEALQRDMLERALTCAHCVVQQQLVLLWQDTRAVWPLEGKLVDRIVERERLRGLEGLLLSTCNQSQVLSLAHLGIWMGLSAEETAAFLQKYGVPFNEKGVASEHAFPIVQKASRNFGTFDIKGQK